LYYPPEKEKTMQWTTFLKTRGRGDRGTPLKDGKEGGGNDTLLILSFLGYNPRDLVYAKKKNNNGGRETGTLRGSLLGETSDCSVVAESGSIKGQQEGKRGPHGLSSHLLLHRVKGIFVWGRKSRRKGPLRGEPRRRRRTTLTWLEIGKVTGTFNRAEKKGHR